MLLQVVQQSFGSGRSFFISYGRKWNSQKSKIRPEVEPRKIKDPAGTNQPQLSSGAPLVLVQPRSQGLRGETVTKTLVKFVLSFQNFGKKIACAVRHNRIAITVEYGCVALRMRFFSPKFWNDKTNFTRVFVTVSPRRPSDRGWF